MGRSVVADMATTIEAATLLTRNAGQLKDEGKKCTRESAMAKYYASEVAVAVSNDAVQIFGGRGYMRENVAERFFRELRVDRIWEGTSEIQRLIIAQQLFKRGQNALIG